MHFWMSLANEPHLNWWSMAAQERVLRILLCKNRLYTWVFGRRGRQRQQREKAYDLARSDRLGFLGGFRTVYNNVPRVRPGDGHTAHRHAVCSARLSGGIAFVVNDADVNSRRMCNTYEYVWKPTPDSFLYSSSMNSSNRKAKSSFSDKSHVFLFYFYSYIIGILVYGTTSVLINQHPSADDVSARSRVPTIHAFA